MSALDVSDYEPIFYPRSMAVIGASENPMKFGGMFLKSQESVGFTGKIYPVNPKADQIMGMKAYPRVEDIPDEVDFAVISVPAEHVLAAVKGCVKKKIKGAEILAAGFREAGEEGEALEREVTRVARKGGLRLVGPNGFGIYSPAVGLTLMPGSGFPKKAGNVGLISQSGGMACDTVYTSMGRNVFFTVAVSIGNGMDIDATELLSYFEADDRTKIVGAYIEGVRDGRAFFKALKSLAAKKPVVILKGGVTDQGHRGTMGHTGSMAGSKEAWEAAVKSAGAVSARDSRDLAEMLMAFNCLPGFTGGGAGILAGGGLRVVDGLDAASTHGFPVPELDDESADKIQAMLPPAGGRGANPVDLANPVMSPAVINPAMEILAARPDIDFMVLYQMFFYLFWNVKQMREMTGNNDFNMEYHTALAQAAVKVRKETGKPLMAVLLDIASHPDHIFMEKGRMEARAHFTENGIPCFDTGLQAFSALRRVADYYTRGQALRKEG